MIRSRLVKWVMALGGWSLISCSTDTGDSQDVNQESIHGYYLADLSEDNDKIELYTWFRFAGPTGTTLQLTDKARISANNQPLSLVSGKQQVFNITGTYYHSTFALTPDGKEVVFDWVRNDGKSFQNKVPVPQKVKPFVVLAGKSEPLSKEETHTVSVEKGGFTATFEGSNLGENESIECVLRSEAEPNPNAGLYFLTAPWNSKLQNCVFGKEALKNFSLGKANLNLTRVWKQENKAAGHEKAGSLLVSQYRAKPISLEMVP
jgi:hypothetical protein